MPRIQCPKVEAIVALVRAKQYRVFENPNGHDLNLVGIRNSATRLPTACSKAKTSANDLAPR